MRRATYLLLVFLVIGLAANAQEPSAGSGAPSTPEKSPKGVQEGRLIHRVAPVYPPEAKAQRIEGAVTLSATIAKDGLLRDIKLVSGDPVFTKAATDAVAQWQYEPYRLNGEPVEVETSIKINFVLPSSPALYERSNPAPVPEHKDGTPQKVRVSQGVIQGLIQKKVPPQYPPEARNSRLQGGVVLAAVIDFDGKVKTLRLVSGHPLLVPAAVEAVRQWEYRPFYLNGTTVQVDTQITVNFILSSY